VGPETGGPQPPRLTVSGSDRVACPSCGYENRSGARYCGQCASALQPVTCADCGAALADGQRFCDHCGEPVAQRPSATAPGRRPLPPRHLAARILEERAALPARGSERKIITSLFADIEGSVELMQDLDPEAASEVVDPLIDVMIETIHEFDGYVDKCTGDGILALFGAPVAQEDHAQRAALAALRIQEKLARYAEDARLHDRPVVHTRIGLNSGQAVLRSIRKDDLRVDYTPIGHATNLAARLQALAPPGGVLASESTFRLAEGFVEFRAAGAVSAKGVRDPVQTYEVVGVGPLRTKLERAARRGLSPFTGRDTELGQLQRTLGQALAGHGQVVALLGEPGIGKSRLFREFIVDAHAQCLVLEAHCLPHGRSLPYLPLIALLRDVFGIVAEDEQDVRHRKMADRVAALDPALEDAVPYLLHLLGASDLASPVRQMDAGIRRRRTFDAVKRLLHAESVRRPMVLVFEDLQWIDGETQAMLDTLVDGVVATQCLLLVNYRPEYQHRWGRKTYYTQLSLEALDSTDGSQMLRTLLGDDPELDGIKRLIVEKSEGNPFFIEEIVQALFDRQILVRRPTGVAVTSPLTIQIPETVQGVLAARIDRLPDRERQVLQTLAVIGRAFSLDLAEEVVDVSDDDLQDALADLQDAEFIYERPTMAGTRYTFKHALTQVVAYESLLGHTRRELHERVAEAIEALHPTRLEDYYGELAHHFQLGGNARKAVGFLQLTAGQAVQRSAHKDAVEQLTTALGLLAELPEGPERLQREVAIQVALGPPLALTRGYGDPEVGRSLRRARALCEQVGATPQLFPVLFGLWAFNLVRGELRTAHELGTRLLEIAEGTANSELLLEAHRALGATTWAVGELAQARQHLEAGIRLYDVDAHAQHAVVFGQDPGVSCLSYQAIVLWHLGHPDAAEQTAEEAVGLAGRIGHPFSQAFALDMAAAVHQFRRQPERTLELAERAVAVSTEHGFPMWSAFGRMQRAWALAHHRRDEVSVEDLHQALAAWRATGAGICGPYLLGMIAEACGEFDEPAGGLPLIAEALDAVDSSGEVFWEPELHRLRGRLIAAADASRAAEVESCLRTAIAIAHARGARGLELRAALSLSAWLAEGGNTIEAHAVLSGPLRSFAEGFDTADLQEAELLAGELARRRSADRSPT
jgi:class 3 adenylate cyclase/tetratricopeptide (TPR) repeat protein